MQHHRSIGTATLVALMAAHRAAEQRQPDSRHVVTPLDARQIDHALEQLWTPEPPPSGGERHAGA